MLNAGPGRSLHLNFVQKYRFREFAAMLYLNKMLFIEFEYLLITIFFDNMD